jgi:hypothetical protein
MPPSEDLTRQVRQQRLVVQGLQQAVYSQPDPTAGPDLLAQLSAAQQELDRLEQQRATAPPAGDRQPPASPHAILLGPESTGLEVQSALNMQPVPTGIYHLLDPDEEPLLTVRVTHAQPRPDNKPRRVGVRAWIEGLSAETVRTVEIPPYESSPDLKLLPTLFPERAQLITEVQRATLHLRVDDLDGKPESHETFSLVCLARTSSFNATRDPQTGRLVDLTHYYGAWVTPYVEAVQERVRRAAALCPSGMLVGYQRGADAVREQAQALYRSLQEWGITYVHSVIDYGASPGLLTQRTRLPRESLAQRMANCIDGAVLFASLLEGISLHAALLLVPGHALVAWETLPGSDQWQALETTMLGSHDFDAACASGQKQYEQARQFNLQQMRLHKLPELRERWIWPMEGAAGSSPLLTSLPRQPGPTPTPTGPPQ